MALDSAAFINVIIALGMAVAFLSADRRSKGTWYLAAFLACVGFSICLNVIYVRGFPPAEQPWQAMLPPWLTALSIIFAAEWIFTIRRTIPAGDLRTGFGDAQLRLAQIFAVIYALVASVYGEWRAEYFVGAINHPNAFHSWYFWMFAAPFFMAVLSISDATLITLRRRPDKPEAIRLLGLAIAAPFMGSGLVLPAPYASIGAALGHMIFLISAVQYHVMQGQRVHFLNRFLAPSVARMVKEQGLGTAMQQKKVVLTAVACDLRGYTAFADQRDSKDVLSVLHRFYDEVGEVARAHGATIKDYAGDGVLLIFGAPLPMARHQEIAVQLAVDVRARILELFSAEKIPLGVGFGVATGEVSVGVIGEARLEYVAVGKAINLAARLCQQAASGEILIDDVTHSALSVEHPFVEGGALELKGFSESVVPWVWAT